MSLRSFGAAAALAIGALIALPAIANAYPSYTVGSVNQRVGPGVGYAKIGTLPPGVAVDVHWCQSGWCEIGSFLGNGWVSAGYLGSGAPVMRPPVFVQPFPYPYPYPRFYPRVYRPAPGFQFYIGPRRWW